MAEYFTNYELVQRIGNLAKVEQADIEPFFPEAKREVIDRIGTENYEKYYAASGEEHAEHEDYLNIRLAETRFTLYYLIPAINISSAGDGITKARGVGDGRKENLSENEIDAIILRHKQQAEKLLKPYSRSVDNDEDENQDILITPNIGFSSI